MRKKIQEWAWRYGPAELVSIASTLAPALLVRHENGSHLQAALAATWGGNVGYFGTILIRDIITSRRTLKESGRSYTIATLVRNIRFLLIEFGVAELFDTFLIRPTLMYYLPLWFDNFTKGILAAKFLADLTFYLPAIVFYEWSKSKYRSL